MRIAFLFPGSSKYEALDNWVNTIGRHTRHEVTLARRPQDCVGSDCAFVLTESNTYPRVDIDADLATLAVIGMPFGVIHNNDTPGKRHGEEVSGIPTPGSYPSFCWTFRGCIRLDAHKPMLFRQPVFPPIVEPYKGPLLIGTFGHIEPKKQTFEMNRWARKVGVPFVAVGPDVLTKEYEVYYADLRSFGCRIRPHAWFETIEEIAPSVADVTHFLFVLTDSKKGTGGSPTSPRYAGFFNRPIIVVDDETLFVQDGYHVYASLNEISADDLDKMKPPDYAWGPDAYLDALTRHTMEFWKR